MKNSETESNGNLDQKGMTRRSFFSIVGLGATVAAGSTMFMNATGCSSSQGASSGANGTDNIEFDSYDTDILIVGAGCAASATAWSALRSGKQRIMMIEKGPRHSSGHSNQSVTVFNTFTDLQPETPLSEYPAAWLGKPLGKYLVNTPLMRNAFDLYKEGQRDYERRNRAVTMLNHGQFLPGRDDSGAIIPFVGTMCKNQRFRHEHDELIDTGMVELLDQTMVTSLLVQDGVCCGVVALHIPTGRLRVIRAKATVVTAAGVGANYGWTSVRAKSAMSPDNTFDVEYAAYRQGLGIAECEYGQYDVYSAAPDSLSISCGAALCADAQAAKAIVLENGDPVFAEDDTQVNDRNYFSQAIGEAIVENGGVYIDLNGNASLVHGSTGILENFGYDVLNTPIPAAPEPYDHGGTPVVDENIMTEIKGLFWSRGAGTYGENGGTCIFTNNLFGNYAGYKAAEYAATLDSVSAFDWSQVSDEYQRLQNIRLAENAKGKRPHEIRHEIQNAFYEGFGTYRTDDALNSSIAELERIRDEDMPLQVLGDNSPVWNRDWKEAIENWALLLNAEMSVKATLMREESRGGHKREAFPDEDDENWSCLIVCKKNGDDMTLEKQDLPALVD